VTKEKRPPVDWKSIPGIVVKGGKMFIDSNSVATVDVNNGRRFVSADLMVSYDKDTIALSDEKKLTFRSKVHTLVIECESGNAAPVSDLYFKEPMPDRSNKPLGGEFYPKDPTHTLFNVDKKSVIYNVLCPNII
jgi:hypothetical protein